MLMLLLILLFSGTTPRGEKFLFAMALIIAAFERLKSFLDSRAKTRFGLVQFRARSEPQNTLIRKYERKAAGPRAARSWGRLVQKGSLQIEKLRGMVESIGYNAVSEGNRSQG
jgi:hypothetical protein